MGGESYKSCRSWADDIYWTRFQFIHFAQFFNSGYHQYLELPKKFSDNMKNKLPENVALRGPGGSIWNVGLTARDDTLYFAHGWQQFVKDHSLEENDLLVFKYNGESQFDVLIFDSENFCEKVAAIFVRNHGQREDGGGCLNKIEGTSNQFEEVKTPSDAIAGVEFASPVKSAYGDSSKVPAFVPSQTNLKKTSNGGVESASPEQFMDVDGMTAEALEVVPSQNIGKRSRKPVSAVKKVQNKRTARRKLSNARGRAVNWVPDSEPVSVGETKSGTYEASYTSNRRPVTEKEKENAFQLAQAACTKDSFKIIMRPTHVYKRFFVSIPVEWRTEHLSSGSQDVILRIGEREWNMRYTFIHGRHSGGLTGKWKQFAVDNNLEEFDVCVFTPAGKFNNFLTMDVSIFRVIEEITPLSKVNFTGKKVGRK